MWMKTFQQEMRRQSLLSSTTLALLPLAAMPLSLSYSVLRIFPSNFSLTFLHSLINKNNSDTSRWQSSGLNQLYDLAVTNNSPRPLASVGTSSSSHFPLSSSFLIVFLLSFFLYFRCEIHTCRRQQHLAILWLAPRVPQRLPMSHIQPRRRKHQHPRMWLHCIHSFRFFFLFLCLCGCGSSCLRVRRFFS